jgi:hypothetical protein
MLYREITVVSLNIIRNVIKACGQNKKFMNLEVRGYKPEGHGFEFQWSVFFFNWPNPSSRTMAVGSSKPLAEMSTRNLPGGGGGVGRPARKAANLTANWEPIV